MEPTPEGTTLTIKNMVCHRCVLAVEQLLEKNQLQVGSIRLGEVQLSEEPDKERLAQLAEDLEQAGFELLDDRNAKLIERVKSLLIQELQSGVAKEHLSIRKVIGEQIFKDYSSVSRLFSSVEGITIEQFFILQKIEKVKEYLQYDELTLGQIAYNLGYSSTQHLSAQFKKVTGMTPTLFKQLGASHRLPIDGVKART